MFSCRLGIRLWFVRAEFQTVGSDWLAGGPMKRKLLPKTWRSNRVRHSRSKRFCSSVPAAINQIHPVQVCYSNSFCVENPSAKPCRRPPMKLLLQAKLPQMIELQLYHLPFSVSLPHVNVTPCKYSWELCRTGQPGTASQLHPSLRIWIAASSKISAVKSLNYSKSPFKAELVQITLELMNVVPYQVWVCQHNCSSPRLPPTWQQLKRQIYGHEPKNPCNVIKSN